MHDYLFGMEAVRFAFVFGVVMSMYLYERRHITTGSIVVPGYIAVFILHPLVLAATFANALASYWLINKLLPRFMLLYGRSKFSVLVLTSVIIQALMLKVSPSAPYLWESDVPLLVGAGYVIPALIAHDMGRQGLKATTKAVLASGVIVAGPILAALLFVPGAQATRPLVNFAALAFEPSWVPLAVLVGAIVSWALQANHSLRAGGFIGVAYLAMLSATWWQVAFLFCVAIVTWFFVTKVVARVIILFGRRKFSAMLLVGSLLSWFTLSVAIAALGLEDRAFSNLASVALTPLFLPGLLANDMERSSPGRVMAGATLGATFVFCLVTWLYELTHGGSTLTVWATAAVAMVTGGIIFDRQLAFPVLWLLTPRGFKVHLPERRIEITDEIAPPTGESTDVAGTESPVAPAEEDEAVELAAVEEPPEPDYLVA